MAIIGAILGDIAGSKYEFFRPKDFNCKSCKLFEKDNFFTDDTVLTLATKYAVDHQVDYAEAYKLFGLKYPDSGYGGKFMGWLFENTSKPYNSFGNGSAMRCSYIGEYYNKEETVIEEAKKSAECTHNHPEGVKGAIVTATCVYMAKNGASKEEILLYTARNYPKTDYRYSVEYPVSSYRDTYRFSERCQDSVPVAIRCFLESEDYETFLRNVLSIPCDTDTLCAIGGGIAEEYYGKTGYPNKKLLKKYLDSDLYRIVVPKTNWFHKG